MHRIFTLVILLLLLPSSALAWWSKEWTIQKKIGLDTQAANIQADGGPTTVLIRLSSGNFDFLSAKDDGSDLRFIAQDDTTPLKFNIERFDKANELAFVWVTVPKLQGNSNTQFIWLYSGNEKAPALADGKATYDATHLMVFHMNETKGLPQDATTNASHATQGATAYTPGGLIAGSAKFLGDGGVTVSSAALQAAKEMTVSAWINPERLEGEVFSLGTATVSLVAGVPVLIVNGKQAKASAALAPNTWAHVALMAGPTFLLYVNGQVVATIDSALASVANVRLGGGLFGQMDEVQLASVVRPAQWVLAQVASQSQGSKLVKFGDDQTTDASEGPSYFVTTMKNVTVDGWVVVIICLLMFVVAVWVMIAKTLFLNRVEKANKVFAVEFGKMSRDMAELDDNVEAHSGRLDNLAQMVKEFKHSSLYRIYHVGVTEIKHRFPAQGNGQSRPVISDKSFNAVRASLDAQMTREGQRMNKTMVLLTIAISGGPFLGLLGTVVGVMITFAAIAAAGDVNVNAIAPGIAAALVATVAGLGVAIPALFGYNYLMTKIKEISADMNVFVDEFVTKMAENYGG